MNDFGTFNVRLTLLSPVHIGCGEDFEPTNFVITDDGRLLHFDFMKFLKNINNPEVCRSLSKDFSEKDLFYIHKLIYKIYTQNYNYKKIGCTSIIPVSAEIKDRYKEQIIKNNTSDIFNQFHIARTSFCPNTKEPYIPGSSIKGALRTSWISGLAEKRKITTQPDKQNSSDHYAKKKENELLNCSFCSFQTDPFRLLKVSDFYAEGKPARKIVYKINKKKEPNSTRASSDIPIILETIQPNSEFIGSITISNPLDKRIQEPIKAKELFESINKYFFRAFKRERETLQRLNITPILYNSIVTEKRDSHHTLALLRIGQHCGAECMTLEGNRSIKIKQGPNQPAVYKDHSTTIWLASEKHTPDANDELHPFGWVLLEEI